MTNHQDSHARGTIAIQDLYEVQLAARKWATIHIRDATHEDVLIIRKAILQLPRSLIHKGRLDLSVVHSHLHRMLYRH